MTAENWHDYYLDDWKKYWDETSLLPVLFSAVAFCTENKIPQPEWVSLAVLNVIIEAFNIASVPDETGAHSSVKGRMAMDYAHFLRWSAVRSRLAFHRLHTLPPRGRRGRPATKPASGQPTRKQVVAEAKSALQDSPTALFAKVGSEGTLEDSYLQVEESRAKGESRFRFDDFRLIVPKQPS